MTHQIFIIACLFFAVIAALLAGVFQAFSDFVMRGLSTTPGDGGMAAMQRINITVMRSWFLAGFIMLVPGSIILAVVALGNLQGPALIAIVLAAAIYLVVAFGVTMLGNVPMNNALAQLPEGEAASRDYWQHYLDRWTSFNSLRMTGCIVTACCYLYAAIVLAAAAGLN